MNDALRQAASVDPEWAKKEQRRQWLVKATVVGTLIALAVGVIAFVLGVHNSTEITQVKTKIEHSACQVAPAGEACQRAKARSSEAANLYVTCIPLHKAGYPCPKPGSEPAERAAEGGGANSSPSTGHSLPGRHEGGSSGSDGAPAPGNGGSHHAPVPGEGGSEGAPVPGTPTAPAPTAPSSPGASSSSTERITEAVVEAAPPAEAPKAPVREALGATVEGLGETVTGTVEGVTETTCSLASLLCHE